MAAKRKRNYKAEYARRIRNAEAKGKSRQQARGHIAKEHVERSRRTQSKFGASPSTLTRARAKALDHLSRMLSGGKKPVDERTLERGIRLLHIEDLRSVVEIKSGDYLKALAAAQATQVAALADVFPYSIDDIEEAERNPIWYHR